MISVVAQMPTRPAASAPDAGLAALITQVTASAGNGQAQDAVLVQFLEPLLQLAGAQAGLVRVLTDDDRQFRLAGSVGVPAALLAAEQLVDRHCGSCGLAASHRAAVWATQPANCQSQHAGWNEWRAGFASMLVVPLRHREQLLGLYNLFFAGSAAVPESLQSMLQAVGGLLGMALHNARLERERLRSTVMDERKLLASEVHDGVAQTLVYANMRLPLLQDAMNQGNLPLAQKYFSDVEQALAGIHGNLRDIMANFRTPMAAQGLLLGLQDISHTFGKRSGIAVELHCAAADLGLSVEQEVQVFHIVQESLSNVMRHARAAHAWITVQRNEQGLVVLVEDDGTGLQALAAGSDGQVHFGLGIMQERAQRMGASLHIGARPAGGTAVELRVPASALGQGMAQ